MTNNKYDIYLASDYVFIKSLDNTFWWSPGSDPKPVIQLSVPPVGKWTSPDQVYVERITDYYANHTIPFVTKTNKYAWPPGYYPLDSDGGYSEYTSANPPMAADGILFWPTDSDIKWVD